MVDDIVTTVQRKWRQLLAYLGVCVVTVVFIIWADNQLTILHRTSAQQQEERYTDIKRDCLQDNRTRELFREIGLRLSLSNAEALIDVVPQAPPDQVEAYRRSAEQRAQEILDELDNKDCNKEVEKARQESPITNGET